MDEVDPISKRLHGNTDGVVWAEEFCKLFSVTKKSDGSTGNGIGLMIGWFANAIETGRDAGARAVIRSEGRM